MQRYDHRAENAFAVGSIAQQHERPLKLGGKSEQGNAHVFWSSATFDRVVVVAKDLLKEPQPPLRRPLKA